MACIAKLLKHKQRAKLNGNPIVKSNAQSDRMIVLQVSRYDPFPASLVPLPYATLHGRMRSQLPFMQTEKTLYPLRKGEPMEAV